MCYVKKWGPDYICGLRTVLFQWNSNLSVALRIVCSLNVARLASFLMLTVFSSVSFRHHTVFFRASQPSLTCGSIEGSWYMFCCQEEVNSLQVKTSGTSSLQH